jgi:hypothetical protein
MRNRKRGLNGNGKMNLRALAIRIQVGIVKWCVIPAFLTIKVADICFIMAMDTVKQDSAWLFLKNDFKC